VVEPGHVREQLRGRLHRSALDVAQVAFSDLEILRSRSRRQLRSDTQLRQRIPERARLARARHYGLPKVIRCSSLAAWIRFSPHQAISVLPFYLEASPSAAGGASLAAHPVPVEARA